MNHKMWVCVADGIVDLNSLATTRKKSIQREVERAKEFIQPDFEWVDLKKFGYKCVKVFINIEPCS